jgi:(E)-4-hydroxy-3-methylbut-2-enyl-diphosphate synthase
MAYCDSRFRTVRRRTTEVMIGGVGIGGAHPIRLQSMTTSDTQDVEATVRQSIALAEVGCEIVRVTAPNVAAARCLREIRQKFSAAGFAHIPLVADIHFLPNAAMEAVEHVEKIRVNPGNYADRKKFAVREYSDSQYDQELERLHEAFSPLVKRCKELGRAMRIGTNHGSLSDRIMNRYGDSPLGMVESALEFIRIAEAHDYHAIVLSMKASNPKVMIQAYRLLVERMAAENMHYPLHLGVTEAGDGEDGRIKSAIGIGSLLLDGLGDTIRVSLTEDSVYEIPVARAIADKVMRLWGSDERHSTDSIDPFRFSKRVVTPVAFGPQAPIHVEQPPRVIVSAGRVPTDPGALAAALRAARPQLKDTPLEGLLVSGSTADELNLAFDLAARLDGAIERLVVDLAPGVALPSVRPVAGAPLAFLHSFAATDGASLTTFACACATLDALPVLALAADAVAPLADRLRAAPGAIITLAVPRFTEGAHAVGAWRALADALRHSAIGAPLWIRNTAATAVHHEPAFLSRLLESSFLTGALLCDGLGDLVSIETETDLVRATRLAYNVLQGAGARISKTEFVACPSCGRTLFDLQSTTQRIRAQTGHLKGVKIAIMGCIVNGPGEMADADFGYVGGMPGKINLYVGKECVQYNIPADEADQRLIDLIRAHGKWIDPDPAPAAVV